MVLWHVGRFRRGVVGGGGGGERGGEKPSTDSCLVARVRCSARTGRGVAKLGLAMSTFVMNDRTGS